MKFCCDNCKRDADIVVTLCRLCASKIAESAASASANTAMDEIATVLSTCKGASISDQNMIDIAVIKLRQLRQ